MRRNVQQWLVVFTIRDVLFSFSNLKYILCELMIISENIISSSVTLENNFLSRNILSENNKLKVGGE